MLKHGQDARGTDECSTRDVTICRLAGFALNAAAIVRNCRWKKGDAQLWSAAACCTHSKAPHVQTRRPEARTIVFWGPRHFPCKCANLKYGRANTSLGARG